MAWLAAVSVPKPLDGEGLNLKQSDKLRAVSSKKMIDRLPLVEVSSFLEGVLVIRKVAESEAARAAAIRAISRKARSMSMSMDLHELSLGVYGTGS